MVKEAVDNVSSSMGLNINTCARMAMDIGRWQTKMYPTSESIRKTGNDKEFTIFSGIRGWV